VITDLRVPITRLDEAAWIVTAYLVGYTAAMPLLGRAADIYGYRRLLLVSCALFAAGSFWGAVADGLWSLVAARAVQAVGGGGLVPVALAAGAALYEGRARVLALGLVAGAAEGGAVLGPLYGAAVLEALDWRWVFWLNLPLTALVVALVWRLLPGGRVRGGRLDWQGGVLAGSSLLALTIGLSGESLGARPLLLLVAAVLAAAFVVCEARAPSPLLPSSLFRSGGFASANAANLLLGSALVVALVEVPLFALVVLDRSPTEGALMLLRFTAPIPLGALAGGWLAGALPYSVVAGGGMATSAVGFAFLSRWDAGIGEPALTLQLVLAGAGFGIVLAPLAGSALAAARGGSEAVGAASLTIARMLGMTVGLAALTTWGLDAFTRRTSGLPLPLQEEGESDAAYEADLDRYRVEVTDAAVFVFSRIFLAAAALCVLAAMTAAWLREPARAPR
jgi:MFS family permease